MKSMQGPEVEKGRTGRLQGEDESEFNGEKHGGRFRDEVTSQSGGTGNWPRRPPLPSASLDRRPISSLTPFS